MHLFTAKHLLFIAIFSFGAWLFPLPLYLVSLALFGLPHVVWEMGYVQKRFGNRWSLKWWYAIFAVLAVQAMYRTLSWHVHAWGEPSRIIDLVTLGLLFVIVAAAPSGAGWRVRIAGILGAVVMYGVLDGGYILYALLFLSIIHNFTPIAFVWERVREDKSYIPIAMQVTLMFALLFLIIVIGSLIPTDIALLSSMQPLLDSQLPDGWGGDYRHSILSAIVLSQCLHYYSVLYLLPSIQKESSGIDVLPKWVKTATIGVVIGGIGYFMYDYASARSFYAIASGAHAWIEWPVLLISMLTINKKI